MKAGDFFNLIRLRQLIFKNSIIVIALIFSIGKFPLSSLLGNVLFIFLGFLCLSLVSASSYVINDIVDYEKDKNHPEKKLRAVASGKISKANAFIVASLFLIIGLVLAAFLSTYTSLVFLLLVIGLFLVSQFYSFYFREVIFLDIIVISINFVIRAISGVFLIEGGEISYWIILCTFFISMFLVGSKRLTEVNLKEIKKYRESYEKANKNSLLIIIFMSISAFIIFFCVYSILFTRPLLLFSLPVALYVIFLYFNDIYDNPKNIRNPEKFIFSRKVVGLLFLWFLIVVLALAFSR